MVLNELSGMSALVQDMDSISFSANYHFIIASA